MIRAIAVLLIAGFVTSAGAHERSQSYSNWTLGADGRLDGHFTIDARRATLLYADPATGPLAEALARHLGSTVHARVGARPCTATRPAPRPAPDGYLRVALAFDCGSGDGLPQLRIDAMFRFAATHLHFVSVRLPSGEHFERVLTPQQPTVSLGEVAATRGFGEFLRTGVFHVLGGADHVAFLLGLMLLVRRLSAQVATLTAFTLGHSLTLALAALGWIDPDSGRVEALIGFSVLLTAVDAARPAGGERRALLLGFGLLALVVIWQAPALVWLVFACLLMLWTVPALDGLPGRVPALAAGFGLLHGSAFAGVLIDADLPAEALPMALLGFNLGVELGQLLIVLAVLGLATLARRLHAVPARLRPAATAGLSLLGSYWFASRLLA